MAAAIPILAYAELDRLNRQPPLHSQRTGSYCSSIDEALHGGIESGRITCISGDKGTGKTTVGIGLGLAIIMYSLLPAFCLQLTDYEGFF
jgi:hypothetical protein